MAACFQWAFVTKGLRTMGTDDAASCLRGGQRVAQGAGDVPVPEAVSNAMGGAWVAIRCAMSAA